MKRKIFILSIAAILLAASITGTLAYYTATDTARNVITTGNLKIELVETAVPEDGGEPVPFENVDGVMPGMDISKIVQIENTGDYPAYVRVAVEKVITLAEGMEAEIDDRLVSVNYDMVNWTYRDGFYYYNKALEAGMMTVPLFTIVSFDKSMDNRYQGARADIRVKAYAVQAANNGTSSLDAKGWPEE